jgi:uncharacterized protein
MRTCLLSETFDDGAIHPLQWLNPPSVWRIDPARSCLIVEPDTETDFWQRTHYGFRSDNGHLLGAEVSGNVIVTARIRSYPAHQYDQAGLMVRFSSDCWLKTSVEFYPDSPSQLGVVVTNSGYSDWSLEDFPYGGELSYCLRIRRNGEDFQVEHATNENGPWRLMRVAHLFAEPGHPVLAGFYACSPKALGYRAEADFLRIELS